MEELDDVLLHFGVKGMKWGVRKKDESSSVKSARSNLSKTKKDLSKAKKAYNKDTMYGQTIASPQVTRALSVAKREHRYSKEDLAAAKILDKVNSKPKSTQQLKLEEKYKARGLNSDEATVAAYKNIRTKRILTATAITAMTVAGAYGTYKIRDEYVDKLIKQGSTFQNVTADSTMGVRDAFYTANNRLDKVKYKGIFGTHLKSGNGEIFAKEIKAISDIRQASPKNAQKAFAELLSKDASFAKGVKEYMQDVPLGGAYIGKSARARKALAAGKVDKNVYEVFNAALVDHSPKMQPLTDKFYDTMRSKGYNAIRDVNDQKYSGYKTLNPIIAFGTKGKVEVVDIKKLTDSEIKKSAAIAWGSIVADELAKTGAVVTTSVLGSKKLINVGRQKIGNSRVRKYREENPNTQLSNTEIIRMLERGA